MAEENSSETQDTSEEQQELFFGKYKTKEEAEAAFKDMEKSSTEAKEALDREQRLNALLASEDRQQPEPEAPAAQYTGLQGVFDEEQAQAVSRMVAQERADTIKQMRAEGRRMMADFKVRQDTEREFYQKYNDLSHFKDDVDAEANRLALELGERAQKVPVGDMMKEVAKRTREKLATQKSKLTKSSLHVEGGEVHEPTVQLKEREASSSSEEERTQKFFDSEVKDFNDRKFKTLRR